MSFYNWPIKYISDARDRRETVSQLKVHGALLPVLLVTQNNFFLLAQKCKYTREMSIDIMQNSEGNSFLCIRKKSLKSCEL